MPDDFYEQMDRAGILIDGGFQCCDAWQLQAQPTADRPRTSGARQLGADDRPEPAQPPERHQLQLERQQPDPAQEQRVSLAGFRQADFQDPLIASAEYKSDPDLGPSGEKEGPYDWVPPSYWYDTTHYDPTDPTRTNVGGAWAFDSEASAGTPCRRSTRSTASCRRSSRRSCGRTRLQPVPRSTMRTELPGPDNGGYAFGTLHDLDAAISSRYGPWSSLDQYVEEAQVQNYETQRAEFEAYIDHSTNAQARRPPGSSTGSSTRAGRHCCGTSTTTTSTRPAATSAPRRRTSRCTSLYAYDNGTVSVDNLGRLAAERAVGRGQGLRRRRPAARRSDRERHHGRQPGRRARLLHPIVPRHDRRRRRRRRTSSSCC